MSGDGYFICGQYDNHLESASLELDEKADIISYEEYHLSVDEAFGEVMPFGTTSFRNGRNETEVSLKRYKYIGKERDNETGLYYYGARYYAAWLCRFVSVDPLQHKYPHYTPYQYAGNKPVSFIDLDGLEEAKPVEVIDTAHGNQSENPPDVIGNIDVKIEGDNLEIKVDQIIDYGEGNYSIDQYSYSGSLEGFDPIIHGYVAYF